VGVGEVHQVDRFCQAVGSDASQGLVGGAQVDPYWHAAGLIV
jgi:hypothetical protein